MLDTARSLFLPFTHFTEHNRAYRATHNAKYDLVQYVYIFQISKISWMKKVKENPRLNVKTKSRSAVFFTGVPRRQISKLCISHSWQSKAAFVEVKHWQQEMEEMGVVGGCCTLALAYVSLIFQQSELRLNTSVQHSMLRFGLQRDTPTPQFAFIWTTFKIFTPFSNFACRFQITQGAPPVNLLHCPVVKKKGIGFGEFPFTNSVPSPIVLIESNTF